MSEISKTFRSGHTDDKSLIQEPTTPKAQSNSRLAVPLISPIPRQYLSPALDEFSLRKTPSRGATASPAPAKGTRKRLHRYRNFDHAVSLLKSSVNIVVLTGAGISTSVGIPDFRSDKGLYQQLSKDLGITEAEEFFSRDYFVHNTDQFFRYVRRVIPEAVLGPDGHFRSVNLAGTTTDGRSAVPEFGQTHAFLALLQSKGKLLTNYTQNIDGLEVAAGVSREKFIQCHGSWDTASCMTCGRSSAARKYLPIVFAGNIPFCKCKLEAEKESKKKAKKRNGKKRTWSDFDSDHSSDDGTQAPRGLLKPDITFFNERLSADYGDRLKEDRRKIDLLIVIGTSLKVGPVQDMLYQISPKVPQIFISRERFSGALCNLPGVQVDIELLGECDVIINELCRRAGWSEELQSLCWAKGQMDIKEVGRKDDEIRPEMKRVKKDISGTVIKIQSTDSNPPKRLKPLSNDTKDHDINPDFETGSSHDMFSDNSSVVSSKNGDRISRPFAETSSVERPSTSGSFSLPEENLSDNSSLVSDATKREIMNDAPATKVIKVVGSRVKIELVEGTTHQWRVTRR